jgi:hypothetical protein
MTLYSANVLDLATPVHATSKGGRKRKSTSASQKNDPPAETEVANLEPPAPAPKAEDAPKKQLSEKQVAALQRAKEARQRKKEEAERSAAEAKEKAEQEEEARAAALQAAQEKKEAQKEKRRLAREAKKLQTPPDTSADGDSVADIIEEVVNPKKKVRLSDDSSPPTWFKQYVAGVKKEEAKVSKEKKPQRQIAQEAEKVANHQWKDGFTRDRVRTEVDNHMSRMYHMMFGGRRLK